MVIEWAGGRGTKGTENGTEIELVSEKMYLKQKRLLLRLKFTFCISDGEDSLFYVYVY